MNMKTSTQKHYGCENNGCEILLSSCPFPQAQTFEEREAARRASKRMDERQKLYYSFDPSDVQRRTDALKKFDAESETKPKII